MDTFERLRSSKGLTDNERSIVSYILDHPEETARISSRELARRTYTSPTAVLRLSKKLGFENYNALKVNIVSDLKRAPLTETDIHAGDNALAVLGKVAELEQTVIARMREGVSVDELREVSDLMRAARYVDLMGVDANATLCEYAAHLFAASGCIVTPWEHLDRMVYFSLEAPADHIVFLVSRSGTDKTLVESASNLGRRHVVTVALTAHPTSPLARECSHVMEVSRPDGPDFLADVVFFTAGKYLVDTLYAQLVSDSYGEVASLVDRYARLYSEELDRGHAGSSGATNTQRS